MDGTAVFPSLLPKLTDPLWFSVDKACDDENEVTKLEEEHKNWLQSIKDKNSDLVPIGKLASEHVTEEEEEEEEDDGDVDDESDTNDDDELDTDMIEDRDSPDDAEMEGNEATVDSPPWGL